MLFLKTVEKQMIGLLNGKPDLPGVFRGRLDDEGLDPDVCPLRRAIGGEGVKSCSVVCRVSGVTFGAAAGPLGKAP